MPTPNLHSNLRHKFALQPIVSVEAPVQSNPPFAGEGLLHCRALVFIPPPQLRLQLPKGPQLLHFPFNGPKLNRIH